MNKKSIFIQHFITTLVSFVILLSLLYISFSFLPHLIERPDLYFETELETEELKLAIIKILLISVAVFISYIFYLLLSSNSRAQIIFYYKNKETNHYLKQFTKLYEEAPVPYLLLDEEGRIHKPNKSALRFFEATQNEIEKKNIFDFFVDPYSENTDKIMRYFKSKIPIDRQEVQILTKNGQAKWVLLTVFNTENKEYSKLASIFDISKQKELDKAKTEFLSLASHQLKTPVATVKWYLEMLLSKQTGDINEKQKEYILRTYRVNEDMIELIDALLNVSRIEVGSIKPDIKKINIALIIDKIITEMQHLISEKKILLTKKYEGDLDGAESDPKLLKIIIHNLISNAVKYTRENGRIDILTKESFGKITIIVKDNGIGIPKNEQNKLFSKMFRAKNVNVIETSQGTGLGLFLVKSLLDILGAKISFVSEENAGTTFTIKL